MVAPGVADVRDLEVDDDARPPDAGEEASDRRQLAADRLVVRELHDPSFADLGLNADPQHGGVDHHRAQVEKALQRTLVDLAVLTFGLGPLFACLYELVGCAGEDARAGVCRRALAMDDVLDGLIDRGARLGERCTREKLQHALIDGVRGCPRHQTQRRSVLVFEIEVQDGRPAAQQRQRHDANHLLRLALPEVQLDRMRGHLEVDADPTADHRPLGELDLLDAPVDRTTHVPRTVATWRRRSSSHCRSHGTRSRASR